MTLPPPTACPFLGCCIVGPHWHGTASMMPPIETIHGMHCSKAFEERDEARRELAEIKRVLSDYHQQIGTGILAVKRLAKRLHEASAPKADLSATGYFSPVAEPSSLSKALAELSNGLANEAEEAGP